MPCGEVLADDVETIAPDQTEVLEEYDGKHGLTLITCTTGGKNRLMVKCRQPNR